MRRFVMLLVSAGTLLGCEPAQDVSGPRDAGPVVPTPGGVGRDGAGSGSVSVDALLARHCNWCHTSADPTARINLQTMQLTPDQWNEMATGVSLELAPFVMRVPPAGKRTLLQWINARGGQSPAVAIPATMTWRLQDQIAALPDGAPAPGFAFVIEDGRIDHQGWTVQTYTDRHGVTNRGVLLNQTHVVDRAVFSSSKNPSSYLTFKNLPWHGRYYNSRVECDVRVGRWMSIGMHAQSLEPMGRSHRQYVRLQLDRDAISLRSAPTPLETWPWGDAADPRLDGTTDATGFYQTADEWLHVVFQARKAADGVHWTARVTNPATGRLMADLAAVEHDPNPLQGTFFLHSYSTGDKRMWANLVFTADVDRSD